MEQGLLLEQGVPYMYESIFLRTLNTSNGRVDRALKAKVKANGSPVMDERGHHEPGS